MTRLREEDIDTVGVSLLEYNESLQHNLGCGLLGIAAHSLDKKQEAFAACCDVPIAVIPVSCGQGVIGGFSKTVQQIIEFLGFRAFVTAQSDVGGMVEAVQRGAKVVFMADDDTFAAIDLAIGKSVDNGEATGRGYAAALDLLAGGVAGKKVLIIGCGPVGIGAAAFLTRQKAQVLLYDTDLVKSEALGQALAGAEIVADLRAALAECSLIVEATPAGGVIADDKIKPDTKIAAPGIPLGLSAFGAKKLAGNLIHDVLEIGVAVMLLTVLDDEQRGG